MAIIDPIFRDPFPSKPETITTTSVHVSLPPTTTSNPQIAIPVKVLEPKKWRAYMWQLNDEMFHRALRGRFIHTHKGKKPKRGNPWRRMFRH